MKSFCGHIITAVIQLAPKKVILVVTLQQLRALCSGAFVYPYEFGGRGYTLNSMLRRRDQQI
jgi:hypothetical protein